MKPYLESIRRLSRIALMLLVLCVAASVILAMQFQKRQISGAINALKDHPPKDFRP